MEKRIKLADNGKINAFACKWLNKFKSSEFIWGEFEEDFGKDCISMGFTMDSSNYLFREYSKISEKTQFSCAKSLKKIVNKVYDIELLGNAILSCWRYDTHSMTLITNTDIDWFIVALDRLAKITE